MDRGCAILLVDLLFSVEFYPLVFSLWTRLLFVTRFFLMHAILWISATTLSVHHTSGLLFSRTPVRSHPTCVSFWLHFCQISLMSSLHFAHRCRAQLFVVFLQPFTIIRHCPEWIHMIYLVLYSVCCLIFVTKLSMGYWNVYSFANLHWGTCCFITNECIRAQSDCVAYYGTFCNRWFSKWLTTICRWWSGELHVSYPENVTSTFRLGARW